MSSMFFNCHNLRYVNLNSFKSDKLENMAWMFYWCNNLTNVDISSLDINKVNKKLQIFRLSSFDAANESAYRGSKMRSVKINQNSFEEIQKQISSKSVNIIVV